MEHLFILLFSCCRWELTIRNPVVSHLLHKWFFLYSNETSASNHQPLVWLFSCIFSSTPDSNIHRAHMGPSGADRTQVGPMLAPWILLSGTAYWYYQYHWGRYLPTDAHINTLISFPSIHISISRFSGFAQSFLQKNTAKTLWRARKIIHILNIILSTLNPMVIFTWSHVGNHAICQMNLH